MVRNISRGLAESQGMSVRVWLALPALGLLAAAQAHAAGSITIEFNAGYNLVVDSNACSPPTYAPEIATNGIAFCNYGDAQLTDVVAYIGDASAGTPGLYPTRDSATAAGDVCSESACLCDSGLYSLTHVGEQVDAIRYIGDLEVGECSWQYWSYTYPLIQNGQTPGSGCDSPVWCDTNDPNDDLWLTYDVWAVSAEGPAAADTRRVTMRNEISASANKIYPNNGAWFSLPDTCQPGGTVVTNGINYQLGVVNQGFDNDGDGAPDYNAWLQPIGTKGWNPACFRLVKTSGQLIVNRPAAPDSVIDFENQLYFTENPDDTDPNSGITGIVYYEFMCLGGACAVPLTPYQEAASGSDNEKFAGDFGGGPGLTLKVSSPEVTLDKTVVDANSDGVAQDNEVLTYTIALDNTGTEALGQPGFGTPLVVRDAIPPGTTYVAGTAAEALACCTTKILFSFDNGISWTSTEPVPSSTVTDIQWRLQEQFPAGASGSVSFGVLVDNPYVGDPVILNTAQLAFGDSTPFAEDTVGIPTEGLNTIGDTVFADDGGTAPLGFLAPEANNGVQDSGVSESGLGSISLTLYWDRDGDGTLSAGDVSVGTTATDGSGLYSFGSVPDGDWLVVVDTADPDLPTGYRVTEPSGSDRPSPDTVAINDLGVGSTTGVTFNDADFGFGPSLVVDKSLSQASQCGENNLVTYDLAVTNTRPADTPCQYTTWAESAVGGAWKHWDNEPGGVGAGGPDGNFSSDDFNGATDRIRVNTFTLPTIPGTITKVEALFWVYLDGPLSDDTGIFELYESGTEILNDDFPIVPECNDTLDNDGDLLTDAADPECTSATFGTEDGLVSEAMNTLQPTSADGTLVVWDVTAAPVSGGWDFADFANLDLALNVQKQGALDGRRIFIDAIGFRISTDQLCGAPGDDLSVVPLEDQFDAGSPPSATFVSSAACGDDTDGVNGPCGDADDTFLFPNSQDTCTTPTCAYTSTGRLRWSDVGPLLAGETKTFNVTLSVPDGTAGSALADTALSCGTAPVCEVTFFDGTAANNHQDEFSCVLAATSIIGDRVWNDINGNAVDDAEAGIPGVTLNLYRDVDSDGVFSAGDLLLSTTTTDATGAYQFPGLVDGDYVVAVDASTIPDAAPTQTFDRDLTLNDETGVTLSGTDVLDADFGYNVPNFIYGNVWYDYDADGVRDTEDYGLGDGSSFVSVQLYDCGADLTCNTGDDFLVTSMFTDVNGDYVFPNLANGNYQVRVDTTTLSGTWTQTADPDATIDNQSVLVALTGGTTAGPLDFGYSQTNPLSTLGDTLYRDWNGDGTLDTGDSGIANVTVYLYQDNGDGIFDPVSDTLRGSDVTDASGNYLFNEVLDCGANGICEGGGGDDSVLEASGLPAGNWFVWVDEGDPDLPGGFAQTADPDQAGVPCTVCDAVGGTTTDGVNAVLTVDFGYQPAGFASIGDFVWNDADADGIQDAGEAGIGSITVNLYVDSDGDGVLNPAADALVATTLTDADGSYLFENLFGDPSITYFVDVDQTDSDLPTDGGDDFDPNTTGDNNLYVITSECTVAGSCSGSDAIAVTLNSATETFLGADFGFGPGGVIGDMIFEDINGDGVYSAGTEPGIPGVTVSLLDCGADGICGNGDDGATLMTTTDANGNYIFTGLPASTYRVTVDTATLPAATYTQTFDPDEAGATCTTCDSQMTIPLATGQRIQFADFGYQPPFAIGDLIWNDANGDGVKDPGEAGIAGVTVTLTGPGCAPCTTTTDTDGLYFFTGLSAGDYTVAVTTSTLPGGAAAWNQTGDPDVTLDDMSSFTLAANGVVGGGVDKSVNFVFDFGYDALPAPLVTIDKDTTTPTSSGNGQVTFTLVARNTGTDDAFLVRLHDDLSAWGTPGTCAGSTCAILASFSIVEVSATRTSTTNPTIGTTDLTWSAWTINPGGSVSITYTLDVDAGITAGTYDNTADGGYDSDNDSVEDTTFDDDGTLAQDADTPPAMDPESDEDVTITALPVLGITKTCSIFTDGGAGGFVDPTDVLQFDIVVINNGTAAASIFAISDPLPIGTTYVASSSILVAYPDWRDEITYSDDFDAGTSGRADDEVFPNGDDTLPLTDGWIDNTAPSTDPWTAGGATTVLDLGDMSLQIGRNDNPSRVSEADLFIDLGACPTCTGGQATLTFSYRRVNFDTADTLDVDICGTTALTINGSSDGGSGTDFTDVAYVTRTIDVSSLLPTSAATDTCTIQFNASAYSDATGEEIFIDDVSLNRKLRYTLGPDPADPPTLLVPAADNSELLVGESMSVRFQATADNPLPLGLTSVDNTAFALADEITLPVSDSCSLPVNPALIPSASIAGTVWDDGLTPDGLKDSPAAEARLQNVRVELLDGVCTVGVDCLVRLTDAAGDYLFSNLPAGTYTVVVANSTLPVSYVQSGDLDEVGVCVVCDERTTVTLAAAENRTGVDFGFYHAIIILPVTLSSFSATGDTSHVVFSWSTETETGNAGFFLYGLVDGEWRPINEELIPTHVVDSVMPQHYSYEARGVDSDTFLFADVDVRGKTRFHGPFYLGQSLGAGRPAPQPVPWGAIRREHRDKKRSRHLRSRHARRQRGEWPEARLEVQRDGLYRVTYEDLMAAGLDFAGVPLSKLALFDRHGPVPILVSARGRSTLGPILNLVSARGRGIFGPGSAIVFAGQALESLYTDTHIYTLRVDLGSALRVKRNNTRVPPGAEPTTTYRETVRVEGSGGYSHAALGGDPWYDRLLMAFGGPATSSVELIVDDYVPGAGTPVLTVETWGYNDWPASPDHHLVVGLNGVSVADDLFDGRVVHEVRADIPEGFLREGSNSVDLTLPFDVGVPWDLVALEASSITYPRRLLARDGQLVFDTEGAQALRVEGLSDQDVTVLRVRGEQIEHLSRLRLDQSGPPGSYGATFAGLSEPATFLVAGAGSFLTPGIAPAPARTELVAGAAQYLIISHPDFIDALGPLVEAREQDFTVKVVNVEQIYAAFSGGIVDPLAIRDYVRLAAWEMGTEYLLLVGGDSLDYKDDLGLGSVSFIPSMYVPTAGDVLFNPADPLYGDLDGDGVPELAVGRLPVRTAAELESVLTKTLEYQHKTYGRSLLSASDTYDTSNRWSFLDANQAILNLLDPSWWVERADVDLLGAVGARQKVIASLNQGVALAQYFGHSGPFSWSMHGLLTANDAALLENQGRPAVIAQWGCFNTYYVWPTSDTMAHKLMLSGDHGAAAVLGATTLTGAESDLALGQIFLPKLALPGATIGKALVEAKRELAARHPEMTDVIIGWTLLGDPALVVTSGDGQGS